MLKRSAAASTGGGRSRLRSALAAAELALATVLLIGAGLLVQSLLQLQRVHLGFEPGRLLTFQLSLPPGKYPSFASSTGFYRDLVASMGAMPGVRGAAVSSGVPFGSGNYTTTPVAPVGRSILPPDTSVPIDWRIVSPGFFRTMQIPLLRGRDFTDADGVDAPAVMILSQATASKFWGDDDPVGRTIHRVGDGKDFTVVGVVGDVRNVALSREAPSMYFSAGARVAGVMDVVVRTEGRPESALAMIREKVRALDADLPVATVRTMEEWLSASAAQPRLNAVLLAVFAGVAVLVAAIGIYGVLAYSVNQRRREIGLRMALGAQRGGVIRLIVREGMTVGLTGIALGLAGALGLSQALASLLFRVPSRDPATFAGVTLLLAAVALAACTLPAQRASRVDPIVVLREE
jgi:predicted permease